MNRYLSNDQWLIRAKDWLLLVGAVAGMVSWGVSKFYASPLRMEMRLDVMEVSVKKVDDLDRRETVLEVKVVEQNDAIMRELRAINRKLGR